MKHVIFIAALAFSLPLSSQRDSAGSKAVRLYAFSLRAGALLYASDDFSYADFQRMAPNSGLLKTDVSRYDRSLINRTQDAGMVSLNSSFVFYNKKRKRISNRQEFTFGITYQDYTSSTAVKRLTDTTPFDTLISNTNPTRYYIDREERYSLSVLSYWQAVSLEAGHTFHSRQNRILSYYIGYNLSYGRMISHSAKVSYSYNETCYDQNGKSYDYKNTSRTGLEENTSLPLRNVFQAGVPFGVLMRFSNTKANFVRRIALNLDARPGYRISQISGYGNLNQFMFSLHLGIKYFMNREAIR